MIERRFFPIFFLLVAAILFAGFTSISGQTPRDYMTEDEIELVRDAQDIDLRVDVLTKMIDRRFAALKIDTGGAAVPAKDTTKWGPAPTGTQTELLDDIKKLLEKGIDDIDNVAQHPVDYSIDKGRSEKQKKKDEQRFPDAVRNLAASAKRYQPALKSMLDKVTDEKQKGLVMASMDFCDEIISASTKIGSEAK
jgi:hypothetical protein